MRQHLPILGLGTRVKSLESIAMNFGTENAYKEMKGSDVPIGSWQKNLRVHADYPKSNPSSQQHPRW